MTDITAVTHPMIHIAPKDLSVDFMSAIFGPVVDAIRNSGSAGGAQFTAATAGDSLLGSMMQVMNETMLFLAALYIVYITITHSLRLGEQPTGSEGLQIRGSSLWTPVRIPLAVSALLPYAGGYSFLQLLVLWLALNSVGAADALHRVFVEQLPAEVGRVTVTPKVQADTQRTIEALFAMHVCVQSYNKMALRSRGGKTGEALMNIYRVDAPSPASHTPALPASTGSWLDRIRGLLSTEATTTPAPGTLYRGGIKNGPRDLQAACGSLRVSGAAIQGERASVTGWISHLLAGDGADREAAALRSVYESQRAALGQVAREITDVVHASVHEGRPYPRDFIRRMSQRYRALVQQQASHALESAGTGADMQSTLDRGWILAGAWPLGVLSRQQRIQGALDDLPQVASSTTAPHWQSLADRMPAGVRHAMLADFARAQAVLEYAREPAPDALEESDPGLLSAKILKALSGRPGQDPLMTLSAAGRMILDASATMAAGWALAISGATAISGVTEAATGKGIGSKIRAISRAAGGTVIAPATGVLALVGTWMPLLLAGAILAYVVPLLPVALWIAAVATWLVLLVEAVIAAVLWVISWLHPEGDTPAGRGAAGWVLLLGVLLRPALMICGLAAAIALSSTGLTLVSALLVPVSTALSGPGGVVHSLSSIVGMIVLLLAWAALAVVIIRLSYNLIQVMPDRVLRWLNAGVEGLSASAHEHHAVLIHGLQQGGYGIAGAARGGARRMLPRG